MKKGHKHQNLCVIINLPLTTKPFQFLSTALQREQFFRNVLGIYKHARHIQAGVMHT